MVDSVEDSETVEEEVTVVVEDEEEAKVVAEEGEEKERKRRTGSLTCKGWQDQELGGNLPFLSPNQSK